MTEQSTEPAVSRNEPQSEPQPEPQPAPVLPPLVPPVVKKDRRRLRAALRWTAAVAVFAAVGTTAAYGITRMERTDVPGLATASDGRWVYPEITLPPLPSGSPGPFDDGNTAGIHHADLRALVLPAPEGATEDKALRGSDGWLAPGVLLREFAEAGERDTFRQKLVDSGLRHIAARGWTTEDGTHTRIYLLRFEGAAVVDKLFADGFAVYTSAGYQMRGTGLAAEVDEDFLLKVGDADDIPQPAAYVEAKPYGAEQVRYAYQTAGDTLAVILQSRKGEALAVPFQQTVTLQRQLLR
ncbi:hypothetical protein ACOT81_25545 [Streptomyces sp. WI04-05B]|uniref:hypothetical protein n=1 Tax=Streptomyces TaxID=1883 RepID=UPI0029BACBF4|nr:MULTISPECIES: hypothetical protein [unclassified Streptomyces]MDX2544860.1 hypothetical protein [Streptomyces sp. WI04-05B]MDX2588908.1 hypothetical protein [Streptomyces sp. WI04-05A]MDX3750761.1 hypothetical protein [Streptomyces sp. AK08-02]